jgi:hypothetical protein
MIQQVSLYNINNLLVNKMNEMKSYNYHPDKKFLTIIACHINTEKKLNILRKNIQYMSFENNAIIIINSTNLPYNKKIQEEIIAKNHLYVEIENDKWIDSGKWFHVLNNMELEFSNYDFIIFTNDSFSICNPILHFFNLASYHDVELFAYTSSTEIKYHFQSYLFSIKNSVIQNYINFLKEYMETNSESNGYKIELEFTTIFPSKQCFLDIGLLPMNHKKNIFFHNQFLYSTLFKNKVLPFVKVKQIDYKYKTYNANHKTSSVSFNFLSKKK